MFSRHISGEHSQLLLSVSLVLSILLGPLAGPGNIDKLPSYASPGASLADAPLLLQNPPESTP